MSGDLRDLYQEMMLDHYKKPRNYGEPDHHNRHAEGYNPLCGDRITVFLQIDGDTITDVRFEGAGCAICMASTSVMTELLKGRGLGEVEATFGKFHGLVTARPGDPFDADEFGKLAIFSGVREYPIRVKCATLPWHTLQAALASNDETVTTE